MCQLVTSVSRLSGHPVHSTMLFNVSLGEEKGLGPRDGYDKDSGTRLPEFEFYPYFVEAL